MKVINIKDFCIPAKDADYDELSNFADEIAELATHPIEAEPVRRGRWIWDSEDYHCSECFFHAYGNTLECMDGTYKHCPQCGALMEGEE